MIDFKISEIDRELELLVLIGGNSWNIHSPELYRIIEKQLIRGLPLAAICGAVDYLANHGFLEGYRHTGNDRFLWQDYPNYQTPINCSVHSVNSSAAVPFAVTRLRSLTACLS